MDARDAATRATRAAMMMMMMDESPLSGVLRDWLKRAVHSTLVDPRRGMRGSIEGGKLNLKPGRMPIVERSEWPPVPSILEVAIEGLGMDLEAAKGALDAPGGYEWINELAEASASSRKGEA